MSKRIHAGMTAIWEPTVLVDAGTGPHMVTITGNDHGRVYCELNGKTGYGDYECAFTEVKPDSAALESDDRNGKTR